MELIKIKGISCATYPVDTDYEQIQKYSDARAIAHKEGVDTWEIESPHPLKKCKENPDWQPYMIGDEPGEGDRGWFLIVPESLSAEVKKKFKGWSLGYSPYESIECPECHCIFNAA